MWCLLEESENEQWQEVISRRDKQQVKNANQESQMSVEKSKFELSKKIIEVKDRCVESQSHVRVWSCGACHA